MIEERFGFFKEIFLFVRMATKEDVVWFLNDYNAQMRLFLTNVMLSKEFQDLFQGKKMELHGSSVLKQKVFEQLKTDLARIDYNLQFFSFGLKAHSLKGFTRPQILKEIESLIIQRREKNAQILLCERQIQVDVHWKLYLQNSRKIDSDLQWLCLKYFWDQGKRPENYERNSEILTNNYYYVPPEQCQNCGDVSHACAPVIDFPRILSMDDMRVQLNHWDPTMQRYTCKSDLLDPF